MSTTGDAAAAGGPWTRRSSLSVRQLLRLSLQQARFQERGFAPADPSSQQVLESIGQTFIRAYNAAVVSRDAGAILPFIGSVNETERGFAVEGAAMGAAIADAFSFRKLLLPRLYRGLRIRLRLPCSCWRGLGTRTGAVAPAQNLRGTRPAASLARLRRARLP
jgi:hypothetical protein